MANILVIDDDQKILDFVRLVLEADGHIVREARNGRHGVRAYRDEPADLVVCDIVMEGQDGLETILALRREFPDVRVLAVSGGAEASGMYLGLALGLGAVDVLPKPVSPAALSEAVGRALWKEPAEHPPGIAGEPVCHSEVDRRPPG